MKELTERQKAAYATEKEIEESRKKLLAGIEVCVLIHLMNNDVLVDVVAGKIDLKKEARAALLLRGLNLDGTRG